MPPNSDPLNDISWSLLERYVANDLSPAEARHLDAVLADRPAARHLIDAYRRTASTLVPRPQMTDVDAALERLHDRLDEREHQTPAVRTPRSGDHVLWRWAMIGIAGAMAVGVAIVMPHVPQAYSALGPVRTYATTREQRARVTLSDGTTVTLAPQTTLVVPASFGTERRTVTLTGEAYFEVVKTTQSPLIVQTGNVTTRVLGTAFDVTHYRDDQGVRVAVTSGKVAVTPALRGSGRTAPSMFVVTAGMVARVTDSVVTATMIGDLSQYTGWTQGKLTFHNTPVLEVLAAVGHWYGYQFDVADSSLANRYLTAVFEGERNADVLRSLETLLHVTMDFNGQVITLRPRLNDARSPRPTRRALLDSLVTLHNEVGQ